MAGGVSPSLARLSLLLIAIASIATSAPSAVLPGFRGDFQSEFRFPSGGVPTSISVADFDNDGKVDMAVTNSADGTVGVYLGKGDGTFLSPVFYDAGDFPFAVAAGDFNLDGNFDLAVVNFNIEQLTNGNAVSVLIGNGDGTFRSAANYIVGNHPTALAVADLDGDGNQDITIANNSDNTVSVLLGKGDGTFQMPTTYPAGVGPYTLAADDFNGDGHLDLAIGNCQGPLVGVMAAPFDCSVAGSGTVSLLLGNGDGTFRAPLFSTVVTAAHSIAVADLNGDGKSDIVATHSVVGGSVSVLVGRGDGTFEPARNFAAGDFVGTIVVADFNGDGKPDIVTGNRNHEISESLGNGDATFQPAVNYAVGAINSALGATTADFDNDGRADIAIVTDNQIVSAFLNAGGVVRQATTVTVSPTINPSFTTGTVTLTAKVTSAGGTLAGSATFIIDGKTVFPENQTVGPLDGSGQATLDILPLSLTAGTHTVVAVYSGDTKTLGSVSSPVTQNVDLGPVSTQLTSSQNPSGLGQPIGLTATVETLIPMGNNNVVPTGTVTFKDGATVLATLPFQTTTRFGGRQVTFTTATLGAGTHPITATYSGDEIFAASSSDVLEQAVTPDFSLAVPPGGSTTQTVTSGQTATYSLVLTPGGFSGTATMGCSGAPPHATCSVNPASLTLNGISPSNFTVSIVTASSTASFRTSPAVPSLARMVPLMLALILGPITLAISQRARIKIRFSALLIVAIVGFVGCGGGDTTGMKAGTPAGSYSVVVTATAGTTRHSLDLNLIVQ